MWFTRVSIGNPVLATMVMLAFVVMGLFSAQRLKVEQFPNVEFPTVVVQTDYPGASPEIVEDEVTRPLEEGINSIAGISQLNSRTYEGYSLVIVQFNLDMDGRKAADDVREKVAQIRPQFRAEVKESRISRFDPASRPVYTLAVTAAPAKDASATGGAQPSRVWSHQALTAYATQVVKKRLENVRGVGSVTVVGGLQREINVYLRPDSLEAMGVTPDQVLAVLRSETQNLPAGTVRTAESERAIQVNARVKRPEEFGELIVARRGGVAIRLGQVADVVDGPEEVESLALFNGKRTLALDVQKNQGDNTIEVVDGLAAAVAALQSELPAGVQVEAVRDNSRPIRVSVANVRETLLEGAALTIAIVFLFLNSWRSTVITGLTLPIALVGTFGVMYAFGFSINMVTLMALSLCVGLLIDDAIVVRENIVRHVQMGKTAHDAALAGTNEIGLAVLATTLSIVAVFLPIGFMGGIIGKFFHEFGITIVAAVLISMFVSFTLDPMLSSVWHDPAIDREGKPFVARGLYDHTLGRLTHWVDRASRRLGSAYVTTLGWSLRHKFATLSIAVGTLVASVGLLPLVGTEFVPKADYSETFINFYTPVGSSIEVTEERVRQVDRILREMPEVSYTLATINSGQAQGRIYASIYVRLVDRDERTRTVDQMSVPLRVQLAQVPGITVTQVGLLDPVGGNKPISVSLQGTDLDELQRLTQQLRPQIAAVPGLVDLDTSLKPDKPTLSVQVRRDAAADVGLSVGAIAATLRTLVAGNTVGSWQAPDNQSYDVKVRLAPAARSSASDLQRIGLAVGTQPDGSPRIVRLAQVADVRPDTGANQINRRSLSREVEFTANTDRRGLGEVSADIRRVLAANPLPPGYRYSFGGSTKDMQESFGYALSALALGVIFIYMILASQFRSFISPIALMSSLPLTLIGVVLMLLVFRSTLNLFSIIGVVMLMGLVTKNAILLIDFAIRGRAEGLERGAALIEAARVRLRPILMTTLAMVFGMVPLAFALTEGSEQRAPMGQAVIGGVVTSSLLTLVVVPVIYCYLDDLSSWVRRLLFGRGR